MSESNSPRSSADNKPSVVIPPNPHLTELDAKLHQSYDPTSEHTHGGNLLSSNLGYATAHKDGVFSLADLFQGLVRFVNGDIRDSGSITTAGMQGAAGELSAATASTVSLVSAGDISLPSDNLSSIEYQSGASSSPVIESSHADGNVAAVNAAAIAAAPTRDASPATQAPSVVQNVDSATTSTSVSSLSSTTDTGQTAPSDNSAGHFNSNSLFSAGGTQDNGGDAPSTGSGGTGTGGNPGPGSSSDGGNEAGNGGTAPGGGSPLGTGAGTNPTTGSGGHSGGDTPPGNGGGTGGGGTGTGGDTGTSPGTGSGTSGGGGTGGGVGVGVGTGTGTSPGTGTGTPSGGGDNGSSSSTGTNVDVHLTTPGLTIAAAVGLEDHPIGLSIGLTAQVDPLVSTTITINGVPAGGTLSAGIQNNDGSWTLTGSQLPGLSLTPPPHWNGALDLSVRAAASLGSTTLTTTTDLPVTVQSIALAPSLNVTANVGLENAGIPLHIDAGLAAIDSTGSLSLTIGGLPIGAQLSAGIHNGDGTWTLTPDQLPGLTLTPPVNYNGTLNLGVTATSTERGTAASISATLPVTVDSTALAPTLTVAAAAGIEDMAIPLSIGTALDNLDPSGALTVTVTGLPNGASLSAGTQNGDGSWTLASAQLAGLTLTPPTHFNGTLALGITATVTENGTAASTSANLPVVVAGMALPPALTLHSAIGNQDTPIALTVGTSLLTADPAETLSVTFAGVPTGATLSAGLHNSDGSWTLTAAQLTGLTLTPPLHYNGNLDLAVTATASENGTSVSTTASLPVTVTTVAQIPAVTVTAAKGVEDNAIPLTIVAALPTLDPAETLSVAIDNLPAGATLSAGVHNSDGSWTLTSAQLTGLTLAPPANYSGNLDLTVTATASENGVNASTTTSLPVTIMAAAHIPAIALSAAVGIEGQAIPLTLAATLSNLDPLGALSVTVDNLPAGAALSAGIHNTDGSWTLTSAQLTGLTLTPPANYTGTLDLSVTAITSENGTTASATANLPVTVLASAQLPTLAISAAVGLQDHAISLGIAAALPNLDPPESLSVTVDNVPAGATLSAGVHNADGSWTLTSPQLTGLTLTPPANYSGILDLSVTATASENGTSASTTASLPITVLASAQIPNITLLAGLGIENSAIPLTLAAALPNTDPSETLSVTVGNLPTGATLSAGVHNSDGSWTLTAAQLTGLTPTPPANYAGSLNLAITATASENGTTAVTTASLPVTVLPSAQLPTLAIAATAGIEDHAIPLTVAAALSNLDLSATLSVTVGNVPAGATLSAGVHNADGSWTLASSQLTGLTLTPPSGYNGTVTLSVTATASENGTTATVTGSLPITVLPDAQLPIITMAAAAGIEDNAILLTIATALSNIDPSETLSVTLTNLPVGASLSAGVHNADGSWTLTSAQLTGLTLTPPTHYSGTLALGVTATAGENGTTASLSGTLPVMVEPAAALPTLSVSAATGIESAAIPLSITASLGGTDNTQALSVVISGVPAEAVLSTGSSDGHGNWTLAASDLQGLTLTPHGASGTIALDVTAISTEQDGTAATVNLPLAVTVAPVADMPALTVQTAVGVENADIPLSIAATLTGIDASETLAVNISGLPAGAGLSAGAHNSDGSWTLTSAQLTGLTLHPPANSDTPFTLTVAATSTNGASTAVETTSLPITIAGVATVPTISVGDATGAINTATPISISGGLTNGDGSESLTYTIGGVPDGFALNHGSNNGDNTWTVTPSQLAGLSLTSPYNFQGSLHLTATAVAHENDGSTALSASAGFALNVGNASLSTLNLGLGIGASGIGVGMAAGVTANTGGLLATGGLVVMENTSIAIGDAGSLLSLAPNIVGVTFSGLPTGATLSAGIHNSDGTWTVTPAQLVGLTLAPPANSDTDFSLSVAATAGTPLLGYLNVPLATTAVHVIGVAETASLSITAATGNEDSAGIPISIASALPLTDGSESLSITLKGLPAGFTPSAGIDNGHGTWTLSAGELAGLSIKPAAGFTGDATFTVVATTTEREGDSITTSATGHLHVNAMAYAPTVATVAVTGTEDQSVPLHLSIGLADSSEQLSAVTISGLPTGGTLVGATDNNDGTWSVNPSQLSSVQLVPPTLWSGDATLSVTATSQVGAAGPTASTTASIPVHVGAIAIAPTVSGSDSSGQAGTAIELHLAATPAVTANAENYSAVITGVPTGATLSAGLNNGNGSWTLHVQDLAHVTLTTPSNVVGDIHLSLAATTTESSNGLSASANQDITVHVSPAATDLIHVFQTAHTG